MNELTRIPSEIIDAAKKAEAVWKIAASISIAQWALESGWGRHTPEGSNNPFGIKAVGLQPSVLVSTHEYQHGQMVQIMAPFRKFVDFEQAFDYHARLLAVAEPYQKIRKYSMFPLVYVEKLVGIYATDPNYGKLLTEIILHNKLTQYDTDIQTAPIAVTAVAGGLAVTVVGMKGVAIALGAAPAALAVAHATLVAAPATLAPVAVPVVGGAALLTVIWTAVQTWLKASKR